MIGASKILTVSYGTFSCTLEGFDDSFGTMKAIAEYFRDLAADDRYFGAEPPTPDADMLAKIAGREIKRMVAVEVEDNGVTLRPLTQTSDVATPAEPVPEPQIIAKAEPVIAELAVDNTPAPLIVPTSEYDDSQNEAHAAIATPDAPPEGDTESVAAKLRRIRAVVAKNQTDGTTAALFSEDRRAEEYVPEVSSPEETAEIEEPVVEESKDDGDVNAMMSRVSDEAVETDETADAPTQDLYEEEYEAEAEDEAGDNASSNILETVSYDDRDDNIEAEVPDDTIVEVIEDLEDAKAENALVDDDTPVDDEEVIADATEENSDDDDAIDQDAVKPIKPSRARVIKVKKAELQKDRAEDLTDNDDDDADEDLAIIDILQGALAEDDTSDAVGKTSLSAEDEADLMAELADVEIDMPENTDSGINATMRIERTNRAIHDEGGAADEASVSRLLDETNAQLDTDESTRRRSAISHLRAAVAATVADRKFTNISDTDVLELDDADTYRTDLADAIRPQPAKAKGDERTERPAPLILVSEQRIDSSDGDEQSSSEPIRPRRILKSDASLREVESAPQSALADLDASYDDEDNADEKGANIFADSTSFADFAEKMGATELPDLLEAAAAYTAYVEGRPHFARPQIMRQVAGFAGKDEFNREEGLRSFGQLLRQGKIKKIKRGQFEIAESTRFNPTPRIAGE